MIRRIAQTLHILLLVAVVGGLFTLVGETEYRSHDEVVQRQLRVEDQIQRLDTITTQIASEETSDKARLDRLESLSIPATLAKIETTVEYDHNLVLGLVLTSVLLVIERVGSMILNLRRKERS